MPSGIFALLDDIAAIAKLAAAALDDVGVQAIKATKKTAGIVIDDAAVTPRYVVGFAAEREIPIIGKIAWGSLKNKFLYLLPGALLLSLFAPWAITPLLMIGGAYLCFEGYEKVRDLLHPHASTASTAPISSASEPPPVKDEDAKIAGAIRTDFILSAEIMAIALASVTSPEFWIKALVLAVVGLLVTVVVYGSVALIVKADDFGLHLAQSGGSAPVRTLGNSIVVAMPGFLKMLSVIGMLAMLWVGGGILLHGLEEYGFGVVPKGIHGFAATLGAVFGTLSGFITWLIDATAAGIIGLAIGSVVAIAVSQFHLSAKPA